MKKILIQFFFLQYLLLAAVYSMAQVQTGKQILDQVKPGIQNINTEELQAILKKDPLTLLIDVRANEEIALRGGTIDATNNINILRGWLEFRIQEYVPAKDTPIIVYCGINQRSPLAVETLIKMGYSNVKNYADGFFAWKKTGLPVELKDRTPDSFLYSNPVKVTNGVWSAIGATAPPTYENSGHNNNLSFIVTDEGVLVVNAGDNYLLAMALHEEIKKITDKPVKYVVLENEQGHAALGTSYWQEQGVPVIAHIDADSAIRKKGEQALESMKKRSREKAWKTVLAYPDKTFEDKMTIMLGGERIELLYLGPAHGPGDIVVWLPEKSVVIAGDMAFHERMLPIFEYTDTAGWIETWKKFASLNAKIVVPGHGGPTTMQEVTKYTRDYLVYMREKVGEIIENGGELQDAQSIDQTMYAHLHTYRHLANRNAAVLFRMMEFE